MPPRALGLSPWLVFGTVWLLSALFTKKTVRAEPWSSSFKHRGPLVVAALLVFAPRLTAIAPWLDATFLDADSPVRWVGFVLSAAGAAFAIWARYHLGTLWSSSVTLKEGHRVVDTGPYALACHPIYTGMLLMFVGSALYVGFVRALVALPIVFTAFVFKLGREETLLSKELPDAYPAYAKRVKRLVPFVY